MSKKYGTSSLKVLCFGADEDTNLEPFNSIADWLMDNPDVDWLQQLSEASATSYVQTYMY